MKGNDGIGYKGSFEEGKRQGEGCMYVLNSEYKFEGKFVKNEPEIYPNEVQFELISPLEPKKEEEKVAPKGKTAPKQAE